MDQEQRSHTGDTQKEELSPLSVMLVMTGHCEVLYLFEKRRRGIRSTLLSRRAHLKNWWVDVWKMDISDAVAAWADRESLHSFDRAHHPWKYYIIDTIMRGKVQVVLPPSRSLSNRHTKTYSTPLSFLNHTPHKLSKHVGAVKVSLMAIYCVLCTSH